MSGPNARRVDADAPWDFFWTRDDGKYSLMLRHSAPAIATADLPKLRGVELVARPLSDERPAIVFRLQDAEQKDLFVQLCRDILAAAATALTEKEAVTLAIARTWRWHHLLRNGRDTRLSVEEQKGLIGELTVNHGRHALTHGRKRTRVSIRVTVIDKPQSNACCPQVPEID